jgi:hypothetical protein
MNAHRPANDEVMLAFAGFGRDTLMAESDGGGAGAGDVLQAAVRHYLEQLAGERFVVRVPFFARSKLPAPELRVGCKLEPQELAAVSSEAERQGLAVEELLAHAALLYLADSEPGPAAQDPQVTGAA